MSLNHNHTFDVGFCRKIIFINHITLGFTRLASGSAIDSLQSLKSSQQWQGIFSQCGEQELAWEENSAAKANSSAINNQIKYDKKKFEQMINLRIQ